MELPVNVFQVIPEISAEFALDRPHVQLMNTSMVHLVYAFRDTQESMEPVSELLLADQTNFMMDYLANVFKVTQESMAFAKKLFHVEQIKCSMVQDVLVLQGIQK